jgi:hypothetical protein
VKDYGNNILSLKKQLKEEKGKYELLRKRNM